MKKILLCLVIASMSHITLAHPVSFKGGIDTGFTVSTYINGFINYTFNRKQAIGLNFFQYDRNKNEQFYFLQFNNRLRKNKHDAQSNFYTTFALFYNNQTHDIKPCLNVIADYENRLFFISSTQKYMKPSQTTFYQHSLKIGLSPYKHTYNGVSTWFMLDATYTDYTHKTMVITPIYRGFYKSYMWEIGQTQQYIYLKSMIHI